MFPASGLHALRCKSIMMYKNEPQWLHLTSFFIRYLCASFPGSHDFVFLNKMEMDGNCALLEVKFKTLDGNTATGESVLQDCPHYKCQDHWPISLKMNCVLAGNFFQAAF